MNNADIIKHTLNFLDSTDRALSKLIDFYVEYGIKDESLKASISKILDSYQAFYPTIPDVVTGNLNGKNLKKELLLSLEKVEIALHFCDEEPDGLRFAWMEFCNYKAVYSRLIKGLLDNSRFIYLSKN
jgi:hypothetical protein